MIERRLRSPNLDPRPIRVEFVVLHYTAADLDGTLALFTDPGSRVSAHLVISEEGRAFELVPCWDGTSLRAWHAGSSRWRDGERTWRGFNDLSIGIELVNLNGNLLPYSEEQYEALVRVMERLKSRYPSLRSARRVLGHEQVAAFRGKADPGLRFDWDRFFRRSYPEQEPPTREPACPQSLKDSLERFLDAVPEQPEARARFWATISHVTETAVALLHGAERPRDEADSVV